MPQEKVDASRHNTRAAPKNPRPQAQIRLPRPSLMVVVVVLQLTNHKICWLVNHHQSKKRRETSVRPVNRADRSGTLTPIRSPSNCTWVICLASPGRWFPRLSRNTASIISTRTSTRPSASSKRSLPWAARSDPMRVVSSISCKVLLRQNPNYPQRPSGRGM